MRNRQVTSRREGHVEWSLETFIVTECCRATSVRQVDRVSRSGLFDNSSIDFSPLDLVLSWRHRIRAAEQREAVDAKSAGDFSRDSIGEVANYFLDGGESQTAGV